MWRNRTKSRLYILIQDHTVVSVFVKFGYIKLEYKELLLRLLRKTFSWPFRNRGTQRQFSASIFSKDDLRSRTIRNICCKIFCLPASPRIFEHLKNGTIAHFQRTYTLKKSPKIFGSLFSG